MEGLKPSPQERWRVPNPRPKSDGLSQTLAPRAMEPQGRPPRPTRASNLELEAGADVQGAEAREQGDGRRHEHERVLHQRHLRQPRQVLPPPPQPRQVRPPPALSTRGGLAAPTRCYARTRFCDGSSACGTGRVVARGRERKVRHTRKERRRGRAGSEGSCADRDRARRACADTLATWRGAAGRRGVRGCGRPADSGGLREAVSPAWESHA